MYISAKISYSLEMKGLKGRRINMKKENKRVFLRHAYSSSVMYTTLNYAILNNLMATPKVISADCSHYYSSSLLAEEGEKAKAFYWDKTNVAMKENIMKFRSFHQSSISLSDDFLCSSYPGGMDIRSVKAQNRDVMKIHGRKLIGSIIGSGDTVSAASDRRTATEKMRSRRGYEKCQECRMGFTHVYHVL